MKTIILLSVFLVSMTSGLLNAQTNKGRVLLGLSSSFGLLGSEADLMSFTYSSSKQKSNATGFVEPAPNKSTSINFSPKVGYFVIDNLALGIDLNLGFSKNKDGDGSYKYSQNSNGVGPFVKYYFPTPKILPFIEISSSFGSINSKMDYTDPAQQDNEYKLSLMSFGGGVGFAAPLGDRVAFDFLAGYYSSTAKRKENNDDNDRSVTGTLGLKIGLSIFLGSI